MESADIFKKDTIFKDFLALNVHENANKELSSNSKPNPTNGVNTLFVGFFYVL